MSIVGLNGYEDVIREMARLTDDWVQLSEDKKRELDEKLQELILEKAGQVRKFYMYKRKVFFKMIQKFN